MSFKEIGKRFNRALARYSLFLCSLTVSLLPRGLSYGFAGFMAFLGYFIAAKQRKIALESLDTAFGSELSHNEKVKIAKDCFRNMAKSGIEVLYLLGSPKLAKKLTVVEGKDRLDAALAKGKGAILVSAHFGNFPLALSRLKLDGYNINAVLRRMRDEQVEEFLESRRKKIGINSIHTTPRQACVDNSLKALRNNEALFIQLDQNFGTAGVFVRFFNREAATATGPVIFALRSGAPILPFFIVRQADNTHKVIIDQEVIIEKKDTPEETIQFNIQKITSIIEAYIRKYPGEWGWIHRRWKTQKSSGSS